MGKTLVVALVLCLSPLAAGSVGAAPTGPALQAGSRSPLALRGLRFRPGERVGVAVLSPRRARRVVTAGAQGAFTARFPFSVGRCARILAQAFGSLGSRARLLPRGLRPGCAATAPTSYGARSPGAPASRRAAFSG